MILGCGRPSAFGDMFWWATFMVSVPIGTFVLNVPVWRLWVQFCCDLIVCTRPLRAKNPEALMTAEGQALKEQNDQNVTGELAIMYVQSRYAYPRCR